MYVDNQTDFSSLSVPIHILASHSHGGRAAGSQKKVSPQIAPTMPKCTHVIQSNTHYIDRQLPQEPPKTKTKDLWRIAQKTAKEREAGGKCEIHPRHVVIVVSCGGLTVYCLIGPHVARSTAVVELCVCICVVWLRLRYFALS